MMSNNHRSNRRASTSTSQACAACRYQRRKCAPDCILAPYFPHERQRQFQNAHKLFGVSNITKIIRDLDPPHKDEAMRTIIYQSDIRAHDPVGGCYRIITDLQRQIQFTTAQLHLVLHHLQFSKRQHHQPNPNHHHIFIDCDINLYHHHQHDSNQHHHHHAPHYINNVNFPPGEETHDFNFQFHHELNQPSEDTLFTDAANHKASTQQENVTFFTKQENVPYQQHNEDNHLNGDATLFTLTNCSSD